MCHEIDTLDSALGHGSSSALAAIDELLQHDARLAAAEPPKRKPRGSASFLRYAAEVRKSTPRQHRETPKAHADRALAAARASWKAPWLVHPFVSSVTGHSRQMIIQNSQFIYFFYADNDNDIDIDIYLFEYK